MKVRDLVQVLVPERVVWVEDDQETPIEFCSAVCLSERTLDLDVDFIYPEIIKSIGGVNVICIRVKE